MTRLRLGSLFSGAGGFDLGFTRAGWSAAFHAEIDAGVARVLSHHWPDVSLYGDVCALDGRELVERHGPIDILIGGSPCQDLSVAGKRGGLAGARSGLFHEQMRLWDETGADMCLWENVDGARSSNEGKDFGAVLSAFVGGAVPVLSRWGSAGVVAGPRGIAAWRILDAQFFGVPQHRRRVFVLGTRTGRVDPAEILSLAEGVRGDTPPRREAREKAAAASGGGDDGEGGIALDRKNSAHQTMAVRIGVADSLRATNHDQSHANGGGHVGMLYATGDVAHTLTARHADLAAMAVTQGVPRRLTPRECERLMSWPDDWTACLGSDTARYRACGNGVVSNVAEWIAERLAGALQ